MRKFEYVIPVDYWPTKEILEEEATFLRRSKIEDVYYEGPEESLARLRKQDMLSRLSCTKKGIIDEMIEAHETVVLDHRAVVAMLDMLGFTEVERVELTRDSFRKHHYSISLDRVKGLGDFLVVETTPAGLTSARLTRAAERFVDKLDIPLKGTQKDCRPVLDRFSFLPYTRAIGIAE